MMLIQTHQHVFCQHIRTDVSLARNKSGTGGGWDFSQGQFLETVVENTGSVCSLDSGENFLADIHVTGISKFMQCKLFRGCPFEPCWDVWDVVFMKLY